MNEALSHEDLKKLSKNCSAENKSLVAGKICLYYNNAHITPAGKKLAESIFKIMIKDVEIKVRKTLAESLSECKNIPRDIVSSIINDSDNVSLHFIQHYENFTVDDMLQILKSQQTNKQKAVAKRENLDEEIIQYIADKCEEQVINTLLENDKCELDETTFNIITDKYMHSESIKEHIISKKELPSSIIIKILSSLSSELKKKLISTHKVPNDTACDIIEEIREKVALQISEDQSSDDRMEELVSQLYSSGNLTPSLLVRSICMGNLKFFEYSLVYLSQTPLPEVRKILFNSHLDFMTRNLLRKAGVPKPLFPAIFNAFEILKKVSFDCCQNNKRNFSNKVLERVLSLTSSSEDLSENDIEYLISKIK